MFYTCYKTKTIPITTHKKSAFSFNKWLGQPVSGLSSAWSLNPPAPVKNSIKVEKKVVLLYQQLSI